MHHVENLLQQLRNKQTRESTLDNYISIWRQLNKFVIKLDYGDHLSWEEKTALFGAYLIQGGIQSSTLKSYFSAIKFVLKQDGYEWNDKKALLSSLARSCKLVNDRVKIRLPVQKGLLELLMFEIGRYYGAANPQPFLKTLYQAIFCLAYHGMFRVGELTKGPHTIQAENIHIGENKDKLLVILYSSKTHGQESRPQRVKISSTSDQYTTRQARQNKFFCPFKTVIKYM